MVTTTIGVSEEANAILDKLTEAFGFNAAKDMALFAFAYAVSQNLSPDIGTSKKKTKWSTASFDNIDIEKILDICYPDKKIEDSINMFTGLMHAGIFEIYALCEAKGDLTLSALLPK